jgi:hypothetical protein
MSKENIIGILCMLILYTAFFYVYGLHVQSLKRKEELMQKAESAVDENKGES